MIVTKNNIKWCFHVPVERHLLLSVIFQSRDLISFGHVFGETFSAKTRRYEDENDSEFIIRLAPALPLRHTNHLVYSLPHIACALYLFSSDSFWRNWNPYLSPETFSGKSRKHLPLSVPLHNWTATIPKIAKIKKHMAKTFHNMGSVSNNNVTRIRIPGKKILENKLLVCKRRLFLFIFFSLAKKTDFDNLLTDQIVTVGIIKSLKSPEQANTIYFISELNKWAVNYIFCPRLKMLILYPFFNVSFWDCGVLSRQFTAVDKVLSSTYLLVLRCFDVVREIGP